MDLNQLKAEHPDVYKAAGDEAVQKERARVTRLSEFKGLSPSGDKLIDEAVASGATYEDIAPKLTAAIVKAQVPAGDNPPIVGTLLQGTASGTGGLDEIDAQAQALFGYSAEDAKKYKEAK